MNVLSLFTLKYKRVKYGNNININGRLYIHGAKAAIVIGDNVTINSDESINPTSGVAHTHLVAGRGAKITIGNNVGMSQVSITAYKDVTIEDNVLLGSGVKIWDTDFHPINYDSRIADNPGNSLPVHICEGAFIGACAIILKGVTVGKHSIVGAGSVVTKDIPDNEVWAGNPAKFIKKIE